MNYIFIFVAEALETVVWKEFYLILADYQFLTICKLISYTPYYICISLCRYVYWHCVVWLMVADKFDRDLSRNRLTGSIPPSKLSNSMTTM